MTENGDDRDANYDFLSELWQMQYGGNLNKTPR